MQAVGVMQTLTLISNFYKLDIHVVEDGGTDWGHNTTTATRTVIGRAHVSKKVLVTNTIQ